MHHGREKKNLQEEFDLVRDVVRCCSAPPSRSSIDQLVHFQLEVGTQLR
jgi:hypothetical protein